MVGLSLSSSPSASSASPGKASGKAQTDVPMLTGLGDMTKLHAEVPAFLRAYGLQAKNALDWAGQPPEFGIKVSGHSTEHGHTAYHMECRLTRRNSDGTSEPAVEWRISRRLSQLRAGLHDPTVRQLGSSYGTYFCGCHFAQRMRPAGTTSRLDAWCSRLAHCITSKLAPPVLAALALQLLGAPRAGEGPALKVMTLQLDAVRKGTSGDSVDLNSTCSGGTTNRLDGDDADGVPTGVASPGGGSAASSNGARTPAWEVTAALESVAERQEAQVQESTPLEQFDVPDLGSASEDDGGSDSEWEDDDLCLPGLDDEAAARGAQRAPEAAEEPEA